MTNKFFIVINFEVQPVNCKAIRIIWQ